MTAADVLMSAFGLTRVCTHGSGPADRCSQCIGARPKRITLDGARILEDGQDTGRLLDHERVITARRRAKR